MTTIQRAAQCGRFLTASAITVALLAVTARPVLAQAPAPVTVDFDAAMKGLRFDPATVDANLDASDKGNGMLDADELALVSAVLAVPSLNLKTTSGVDPAAVRAAFAQARGSAQVDLKALLATYPTATDVVAGYVLLGKGSFDSYNTMSSGFGAPLKGDYSLALQLGKYLAFDGDADGDGVSNIAEYRAVAGQGRAAYIRAALDPTIKNAGQAAAVATPTASTKKTLGVVLYSGFEVLDVFGPVEMWSYVPDFTVVMISEKGGAVRSAQGVEVISQFSFTTAPPLDILMVPGGIGTRTELLNPVFINYLKEQDKRTSVTTSVCTGSALLAKAGVLKGHKATSNKNFFSMAVDEDPSVDWIVKARWVDDGKYVTSSGVSAGTDMALGLVAKLYGKPRAQALARSLEYEWHEDSTVDPFALKEVPKATTR
ncbi:MAG: DJ-1/PfpI family protein [Vicinamibacterales bacterium]